MTHQIRDAFYIADHAAVRTDSRVQIVPVGEGQPRRAAFMVLHDGRIQFEGSADDLRVSKDPYLREFLFMTLPPW